MILGTSIGATNGAILIAPNYGAVQGQGGKTANPVDFLEHVWLTRMTNLGLYTQFWSLLQTIIDWIQPLKERPQAPDDLVKAALSVLGPEIDDFTKQMAQAARDDTLSKELVTRELLKLLVDWITKMLDPPYLIPRPGWRKMLEKHVKYVDRVKLSSPDVPYLGIASTDVATGALQMFWNRKPPSSIGGTATNIQVKHIMASSSIPAIYRGTKANAGRGADRYRWDGALVANTPIAPALDIISSVERIIVVLTIPWFEDPDDAGLPFLQGEPTVADALKGYLDWMMLAPLRSELRQIDGEPGNKVRIVWPQELAKPKSAIEYLTNPISIIHYTKERTEQLIRAGEEDAHDLLKDLFEKSPQNRKQPA